MGRGAHDIIHGHKIHAWRMGGGGGNQYYERRQTLQVSPLFKKPPFIHDLKSAVQQVVFRGTLTLR
jgi:hypothetical protein